MTSVIGHPGRDRYTSSQNVSRMTTTIPNTTALIVRRTSSTRGRCCGAYSPSAWKTPGHRSAATDHADRSPMPGRGRTSVRERRAAPSSSRGCRAGARAGRSAGSAGERSIPTRRPPTPSMIRPSTSSITLVRSTAPRSSRSGIATKLGTSACGSRSVMGRSLGLEANRTTCASGTKLVAAPPGSFALRPCTASPGRSDRRL